jgi:hypothetical protein
VALLDGGQSESHDRLRRFSIAARGEQIPRPTLPRSVRDGNNIARSDSKRIMSPHLTSSSQNPEVSADCAKPPTPATPLAPASRACSGSPPSEHSALESLAEFSDIVAEVELAYDRLHRTQAMLAYLRMINQGKSMIGQYLDEAKHTYMQALSRYQARDFEEAGQFAAASSDLSRLVEILISRTFHSNSSYPNLVPPPPEHVSSPNDKDVAQSDLDRVEALLVRVQWVIENGTLTSEDRSQVERLCEWRDRLCRWTRRLLDIDNVEDAIEFAEAADAAVCSAEHICRKTYITHRVSPNRSVASD